LYNRPERHVLRNLIIFLLSKVNPKPLLKGVDERGEIKTIIPPPWMEIDAAENGVVVQLSCSLYHTKAEVLNFISKNWKQVEQKKKELVKKTGFAQNKPQPFTDFERDWQIYSDKQTTSYYKLVKKYGLNDVSSASMIISRIKNRIKSLYSH